MEKIDDETSGPLRSHYKVEKILKKPNLWLLLKQMGIVLMVKEMIREMEKV